MSHIIPYISTEPPSIHEDSIDKESIESDKIIDVQYSITKDPISISNDGNLNIKGVCDNACDDNDDDHSGVGIRQYLDKVIEDNHLNVDFTDSAIKGENDEDVMSDCSFEGQFDVYLDKVSGECVMNSPEEMECDGVINPNKPYLQNTQDSNLKIDGTINTMEEGDYDFGDFGAFSEVVEISTDYFNERNNENESLAFTDFQVNTSDIDVVDSSCVHEGEDIDDDFDDFATFENDPVNVSSSQNTFINTDSSEQAVDDIVESFHQRLLSSLHAIDIGQKSFIDDEKIRSFTPNNYLTDECSIHIWKEMTNFDYSPAFVFQWMQSTSYESFMSSIGPDYKELLSSQRATLPLYSVNLTPIEPVLVDNFIQNIHSTTSSSLDLSMHEKSGNVTLDKSSNVDIKNLEDEFIFNTNLNDEVSISNIKFDNRSSMPNLSSAVIKSEGLGGILKSMLKPLNPGKTSISIKPLNPKAEAVLKELPDLSYMTSKVLMFPVLASYDVQDNV